jgi:antirestriction protein ArdC
MMAEQIQTAQQEATSLIVEQLKEFEKTGEVPVWLQPWDKKGGFSWPCNLDGRFYTGVNTVHLLALQQKAGFPSSTWGTYKAFLDHDGQVQKRERAGKIFFYRSVKIKERDENGQTKLDENGNPESITIPMLKCYSIFNIGQTDLTSTPAPIPSENFEGLADSIKKAGIDVRHGNDRAYYDHGGDFVRMPNFEQFVDESTYWAVLAHEAIHWTGAPDRLGRVKGKEFGDKKYAIEELVAETGSVMLLANFGIKPLFQSVAYLKNWIKVLEEDHRLIFKIASQAQRAAEMFVAN